VRERSCFGMLALSCRILQSINMDESSISLQHGEQLLNLAGGLLTGRKARDLALKLCCTPSIL
jgi:hypothetical protein